MAKKKTTSASQPDFKTLHFTIPANAWQDNSTSMTGRAKPRSRLYASITINGIGFHCDAIQARVGQDHLFAAMDPAWANDLQSYYEASGADGPMSTMRIGRRQYAVFLTPFC